MSDVFVVLINNRHGHDIRVCRNQDAATRALAEYALDSWDQVFATIKPPTDPKQIVSSYFGCAQEDYEIRQILVLN
jgi:hypothetical protein